MDAVEAEGVGEGEMDAVVVDTQAVMQDAGEDEDALLDDLTGGSGADLEEEDLGRV